MNIVDKIRSRGKINMRVSAYQLELNDMAKTNANFPDGFYADNGSQPDGVEIGKWDWVLNAGPSDFPSGQMSNTVLAADATANGLVLFSMTDNYGGDPVPIIEQLRIDPGAPGTKKFPDGYTLEWYENDVLKHTIEQPQVTKVFTNTYSFQWENPPNIGNTVNISPYPSNGTEIMIKFVPPAVPPSPQKSFLLEYNMNDEVYLGDGPLEDGITFLTKNINVAGKDNANGIMIDVEYTSTSFNLDAMGRMVLAIFNDNYAGVQQIYLNFEKTSSNVGRQTIKGTTILPYPLNDFKWIKAVAGSAGGGDDVEIKIRFTSII